MRHQNRAERLQIMLTEKELQALDGWRFARRMPSRTAAVREFLKRGLAAEGFTTAPARESSKSFDILEEEPAEGRGDGNGCSGSPQRF